MDNCNIQRNKLELSSAKLRRAKRLYFFVISKHIPLGINGIFLVREIAIKCQDRGLYSCNTSVKDVCFFIFRQIYKNTSGEYQSWPEWLAVNGYGYAPWGRKVA